jgi:DNA-binding NarL/FixJ family response regulator
MSIVKVLIVEKQPIFREALKAILTCEEGFRFVGETCSAAEACSMLLENHPDVAVASCFRDHTLGLHVIKQAGSLGATTKFVVFVDPQVPGTTEVQKVLSDSKVFGVLSPDVSPEEIKSVIKKVKAGECFVDHRITELLGNDGSVDKDYNLSVRQQQILKMISDGFTNKRISSELGISQDTVKTHVRMVLKKLNASDRAQAVSRAYQAGILQQDNNTAKQTNLKAIKKAIKI